MHALVFIDIKIFVIYISNNIEENIFNNPKFSIMRLIQNMTDREIQESLLHNSRAQISNLKSIKNILVFFLVITIIGIVFALFGTMGALSTLGG